MNLLKSYIVNTFIAIVFFAPIAIYNHFTGGHQWNSEDTATILVLGWICGAMLKGLFSAFKITSNDAVETIKDETFKK